MKLLIILSSVFLISVSIVIYQYNTSYINDTVQDIMAISGFVLFMYLLIIMAVRTAHAVEIRSMPQIRESINALREALPDNEKSTVIIKIIEYNSDVIRLKESLKSPGAIFVPNSVNDLKLIE